MAFRSNNPVFARSEEFNGTANSYGNQTYPGNGQAQPGYGADPSQWSVGQPGTQTAAGGPITIDTVVQKTGLSILVRRPRCRRHVAGDR